MYIQVLRRQEPVPVVPSLTYSSGTGTGIGTEFEAIQRYRYLFSRILPVPSPVLCVFAFLSILHMNMHARDWIGSQLG